MLQTKILLDPNGKDLAVYSEQDVEPILDWNKEARREEQKSDWGRHVARIPNVILVQWLNEEYSRGNPMRFLSPEFDKLVQKKLNDPDWMYLRTDKPALQVGW